MFGGIAVLSALFIVTIACSDLTNVAIVLYMVDSGTSSVVSSWLAYELYQRDKLFD